MMTRSPPKSSFVYGRISARMLPFCISCGLMNSMVAVFCLPSGPVLWLLAP
jgi:hypothetical protein